MKDIKIKTWLPVFSGFYATFFEPDETHEIDYINELRQEKNLSPIDSESCSFNYEKYKNEAAASCCNYVEKELQDLISENLKIDFEGLDSPRFYNFSNDSINCSITVNSVSLKKVKKYLIENLSDFEEYLKRYKTRDGFISFFSCGSEVWLSEYWKEIETNEHFFGAILDFILKNEDQEAELNMYYDLHDHDVYIECTNMDELI